MQKVVIIGAGMAGLACGRELSKRGVETLILEKSAGVGGRVATRRAQNTWLDHGLPYLQTGRDSRYNEWVRELLDRQIIQYWTENRFFLSVHGLANQVEENPFFACDQGLNRIGKYLAQEQSISLQTRVTQIEVKNDRWWLTTNQGEFEGDILVMTPPAPQTHALLVNCLSNFPEVVNPLRNVKFDSTLSLLAGYANHRAVPSDWEIIKCKDSKVLDQLFFNSTKQASPSCASLVLHSTAEFAQEHLEEQDLAPIGEAMLKELGDLLLPQLAKPDWWQVHRWRYSRVAQSLELDSLGSYLPLPLFFAGDWLGGGGVEGAYLAGLNTANEIISAFYESP